MRSWVRLSTSKPLSLQSFGLAPWTLGQKPVHPEGLEALNSKPREIPITGVGPSSVGYRGQSCPYVLTPVGI